MPKRGKGSHTVHVVRDERDYAAAQERAVGALTAAHVSVRDAAELLGLSYQRVSQIRPRRGGGTNRGQAASRPAHAN